MKSSLELDTEQLLSHEQKVADESFIHDSLRSMEDSAKTKSMSFKLMLSVMCNVLLLVVMGFLGFKEYTKLTPTNERTPYAGLTREVPTAWNWETEFFNSNLTSVFEAWRAVDHNPGVIALPDSFVEEKELPVAQRFEWDDTKGVYLVNGYHNLHCLKNLARTLDDYRNGRELYVPIEHSLHCLDSLRQDVLCTADDTPRWSGSGDNMSGVGQVRQCRDWSKLEEWAKSYTACHHHIHLNHGDDVLERFKYCKKDSPYAEKIRTYFPGIELEE